MVADPRIIQYIRQQMNAGFRKSQIYDALLEAGWYKEEIDEAFYEVANQAYSKFEPEPAPSQETYELHPKKPLPEKPGFFWKLRNVLFHPGRFFDAVKNEKGITKALGFLGILSFIFFIITLVVLLFAPYLLQSFLQNPLLQQIFQYILLISLLNLLNPLNLLVNYVIILALTLIGAAIIHFFVYILRGSKGFYQTYKALMYASAPIIFLALIFPLYFLSYLYPFADLTAMGLIIITVFWSLYIAIKGLSKLHDISFLKAIAAVVIIPLIIIIIMFFVASMFPLSFFSGMFNLSSFMGGTVAATGFGELGMPSEWQYKYDGNFSITLKNNAAVPITINSVTADCGSGGSTVVLETLDPMHLESGGGITYSTGDEKCALKNPGESYSVSVTVRYLQETSFLKTASGVVTGRAA
ncbi:MAG: Yip1 family protein [Candidatus Aenigmarchaeota archaeon]|nr:Yip1 family protein [Candidatus Aenigmarchaeota archaeon]